MKDIKGKKEAEEDNCDKKLAGAAPSNYGFGSLQQNLQIEHRARIARVPKIKSNHFVKSDPTTTRTLPEPGNSRLGFEQTATMPGSVGLHLVRHRGTRPDQ